MFDADLLQVERIAAALLGGPIDRIERVRGPGRNSGIFRIRQGGANFVLKRYPLPRTGERNRAATEVAALDFMVAHGITDVPRVIATDASQGYAMLEWIDGSPIRNPSESDIDAACAFLASVHALRDCTDAAVQPPAAEACLSPAEIAAQITRRLQRLNTVAESEPALAKFLDGTVHPLFVRLLEWVQASYPAQGMSFDQPIPMEARTLCPADFGFHNSLRRPTGALTFIDFDYFGWDDPVKLVSDFLLHPGMQVLEPLKQRFATACRRIYGNVDGYSARLRPLFPLFALRWCLILLNEFLPERWTLRINAGGPADWSRAKQVQLDRARQSAHSLIVNFRWFPYDG